MPTPNKANHCPTHSSNSVAFLHRFFNPLTHPSQSKNTLSYPLNSTVLREGLFIKKNKHRWERLQQGLSTDPDETARDFVQLVDDLSFAKTYYPTSRVTKYINGLAAKIYLGIYQNRREESNRLWLFWSRDVPLTVYRHRSTLLFSAFVFALFYTVGFFTAKQDPGFIREVFGNAYVDMTEQNIEQGNPFGVYQQGNSFLLWVAIALNNLIVSFRYFGEGILLGVLSLKELGKESMRVGVFNYLFFSKGMGLQFVLAVMIHGLLELTAIVLSCGAGAVMGTGWLFAGTRSRMDAFKAGVKDGVKIVVGLVPVLLVAAFFEGFVTRHYKMPVALNVALLLASAVFIVYYFVVLPAAVWRAERRTANA